MKFGFGHVPVNVEDSSELVRIAESLGYDYAWIPDQQLFYDPYVCLSNMAARTKTIQLGVGVTNPFTRHPAIATRAIATVDEISGGRANLGIGAGNMKELIHPLGLDSSAVAGKCREMAALVRELLAGGSIDFKGKYFQVDNIGLDITPRKDIPIYLAGRGPKILEYAGEVGDGAIIGSLSSEAGLDYAIGRIRAGAGQAGRNIKDIDVVSWVTVHITDDVPAAMNRLRPNIAHLIGGAPLDVLRTIGFDDEFISTLKDAYQQGGQKGAAHLVRDEHILAFSIVGNPEMIAEKVDNLGKKGITQLSLLMPPGTVEDYRKILERFTKEVRPHLKG